MPILLQDISTEVKSYLRVHFYDPSDDEEGIVNHIVSRLDPPFCHCELQLPDDMACSIYMNSKIHFRKRQFRNKNYVCLRIQCTKWNVDLARLKIEELIKKDLSFSSQALVGACM